MTGKAAGTATILVVDDDPGIRQLCRAILERGGYRVLVASSCEDAPEIAAGTGIHVVLADLRMPRVSGMELLRRVDPQRSGVAVVLMSGYGSVALAVEAMRLGAANFIAKPFRAEELLAAVAAAAAGRTTGAGASGLRFRGSAGAEFGGLVGISPAMQQVYDGIARVAARRQPVLITGESGTGKELAARAIHDLGPWRDKPFVAVDCAGLAPQLIESELFGHVRGAFTGATRDREGLLAAAADGTVLLDEIGELPLDQQAKLLRVLQQREIRPVGRDKVVRLDARVIAATNVRLEAALESGAFRRDLYFRLNVHRVEMPPLRARRTDIAALACHFLRRYGAMENNIVGLTPAALERLLHYDWPGNVRELENCMQRAIAACDDWRVDSIHLPAEVRCGAAGGVKAAGRMAEAEKRAIAETLRAAGGNYAKAAKLLGVAKTTVYRKVREYGLDAGRSPEPEAA